LIAAANLGRPFSMWASRFSTAGRRLTAVVDEVTELSNGHPALNGKSNNHPASQAAKDPA
jgi:hypothetical protein